MRCGGPQPGQRGLELERLVHGLAHEALHDVLAPGLERPLPEAPAEPLHAGDADTRDLAAVSVEHGDPRLAEDLHDLLMLARLVVVVAETPRPPGCEAPPPAPCASTRASSGSP